MKNFFLLILFVAFTTIGCKTETNNQEVEVNQEVNVEFSADVPDNIKTPDVVQTEKLGELHFFDGMPSDKTVKKVYDQLDFSRGVESFLSGMPAASIYALLEGLKQAGVQENGVAITENLLDAKSLFLTGNTTTMYCSFEINTKEEPLVVEIPPMVLGMVDDAFFRYVTDVGLTGPDKGQGGKYVFVGPDYEGDIPEGYFVVHTKTYRNWLMKRAFIVDGNLEQAASNIKSNLRVYPLSMAGNPPEQLFFNVSGKQFNTIHANDYHFFEELNAVIQYEPADAFNPELVGLFASIGIKKGKSFEPDTRMKKILTDAVAVGNATARAITFAPRDEKVFYYPDRRWYTFFSGGNHDFMDNGELVLDDRTFFHYVATGITPSMAMSAVGRGSAYAFTGMDSKGNYLDGSKTYKVTLPTPVPAANFWSFTVYSTQHRSLLETDQKTSGIDSNNQSLEKNPDGSFTIWFGPKPPEGMEGNWVQTIPGKSWCSLLRLYGPLQPWMDKSWKPGDFELIDN